MNQIHYLFRTREILISIHHATGKAVKCIEAGDMEGLGIQTQLYGEKMQEMNTLVETAQKQDWWIEDE